MSKPFPRRPALLVVLLAVVLPFAIEGLVRATAKGKSGHEGCVCSSRACGPCRYCLGIGTLLLLECPQCGGLGICATCDLKSFPPCEADRARAVWVEFDRNQPVMHLRPRPPGNFPGPSETTLERVRLALPGAP